MPEVVWYDDPLTGDRVINGHRITFGDLQAEMEKHSILAPVPSLQVEAAWKALCLRAAEAEED